MNMPYTVSQLESLLRPVFERNGVRRATLFSSYAKGGASPASDVDLIDSTQILPDSRVAQEIRRTGVVIYEQ